jgi:hypothetical protein
VVAASLLTACSTGAPKKPAPSTTSTTSGNFCELATAYATDTLPALQRDIADAQANPTAFQGRLRDDFPPARTRATELAAAAPEEIRPDAEKVATTFGKFVDALEAANFDIRQVDASAFQELQDPQYLQASQRLYDYAVRECGLTTSTTSTSIAGTTTSRVRAIPTTRAPTTTTRPATTTTARPTTSVPASTVPSSTTTSPPTTSGSTTSTTEEPDVP